MENIRNFVLLYIDHGKSTLADPDDGDDWDGRSVRMKSQLLDSMDLERGKGITIGVAPVRMRYKNTLSI